MSSLAVVTSRFREAGVIDEQRLRSQVSVLERAGMQVGVLIDPSQWELERAILSRSYDLFFPLTMHSFHIPEGEEGAQRRDFNIFAELERYEADFVGSNALTHELVRDKFRMAREAGIALPTLIISRPQVDHVFQFPEWVNDQDRLIVKPNDLTASVGIGKDAVVRPDEILDTARRVLRDNALCNHVIVQPYSSQSREFTVSLIGNSSKPLASVLELTSSTGRHEIFSADDKQKSPEYRTVAFEICDDPDIRDALIFHATRLFDWFNLKDYARFDFIHTDRPYLIDVNSMPVLGRSFGSELFSRHDASPDALMAIVLTFAAARLACSGRPISLGPAVSSLVPRHMQALAKESLPSSAVPESSVPLSFKRTTARYTMVDRTGAETEVLYFLKALVHLLKPDLVVETGSYKGATAGAIGAALAENGTGRLVTLERDASFAAEARRRLNHLPVDVLHTSSLDFTPSGRIDVLFLDSHRPARRLEFDRFRRFLAPRAVIIWHDAAPVHTSVNAAITELSRSGALDAIILPTPRGLALSMLRCQPDAASAG